MFNVTVDDFTLTSKTVADDSTITLEDTSHPTGALTLLTLKLDGLTLNIGSLVSLTGGNLQLAVLSGAAGT